LSSFNLHFSCFKGFKGFQADNGKASMAAIPLASTGLTSDYKNTKRKREAGAEELQFHIKFQ